MIEPVIGSARRVRNGLIAWRMGGAIHTIMIPIDSYQDASRVSYVELMRSRSPLRTAIRQVGREAVIDRSHETGPCGSKSGIRSASFHPFRHMPSPRLRTGGELGGWKHERSSKP